MLADLTEALIKRGVPVLEVDQVGGNMAASLAIPQTIGGIYAHGRTAFMSNERDPTRAAMDMEGQHRLFLEAHGC